MARRARNGSVHSGKRVERASQRELGRTDKNVGTELYSYVLVTMKFAAFCRVCRVKPRFIEGRISIAQARLAPLRLANPTKTISSCKMPEPTRLSLHCARPRRPLNATGCNPRTRVRRATEDRGQEESAPREISAGSCAAA